MQSKKLIITFLALTLAFSAIFWALQISAHAGGGSASALNTMLLMWSPGAAAIITKLVYERSLKSLGWKTGKIVWLALAYFLPIAYGVVPYAVTWLSGLAGFTTANANENWPLPVFIAVNAIFVFLMGALPPALGEEIGWRGLLVPELAKNNSLMRTGLISGLIWSAWHLPLILFGGYDANTPVLFGAICFTLLATSISIPMAWLRMKSGSLWPAAVLHASHNLFIQAIFDTLTERTPAAAYITTEFGAGLALSAVILALIFWRINRREEQLKQNLA